MLKFGILGQGYIFKRHEYAINELGGKIVQIYDPIIQKLKKPEHIFEYDFDWLVICSPSFTHYDYIKMGLKYGKKIICEKPSFMPWEKPIDDDNINVVLQYRWFESDNIFDKVEVVINRDEDYFKSWKGNPTLTGGIFYNIFIHYIDLAIKFNIPFSGMVTQGANQFRRIGSIDLMKIDDNELYSRMYHDIIFEGKGVKPRDLFYLNWILERCNFKYGMGKEILNKKIEFNPLNWEI